MSNTWNTSSGTIQNLRFPLKLYAIVSDQQTNSIRWNRDGTAIVIHYQKFKRDYLKENGLFKTNNIASFVRQLNLYGFRKERLNSTNEDIHQFRHNLFIRGCTEKVRKMKRRKGKHLKHVNEPLSPNHIEEQQTDDNELQHDALVFMEHGCISTTPSSDKNFGRNYENQALHHLPFHTQDQRYNSKSCKYVHGPRNWNVSQKQNPLYNIKKAGNYSNANPLDVTSTEPLSTIGNKQSNVDDIHFNTYQLQCSNLPQLPNLSATSAAKLHCGTMGMHTKQDNHMLLNNSYSPTSFFGNMRMNEEIGRYSTPMHNGNKWLEMPSYQTPKTDFISNYTDNVSKIHNAVTDKALRNTDHDKRIDTSESLNLTTGSAFRRSLCWAPEYPLVHPKVDTRINKTATNQELAGTSSLSFNRTSVKEADVTNGMMALHSAKGQNMSHHMLISHENTQHRFRFNYCNENQISKVNVTDQNASKSGFIQTVNSVNQNARFLPSPESTPNGLEFCPAGYIHESCTMPVLESLQRNSAYDDIFPYHLHGNLDKPNGFHLLQDTDDESDQLPWNPKDNLYFP